MLLERVDEDDVLLLAVDHQRTDGLVRLGLRARHHAVDDRQTERRRRRCGQRRLRRAAYEEMVVRGGGAGCVVEGVARVGNVRVAGKLVHQPDILPDGEPVGQPDVGFFAHRERHALFGHTAFGPDGVTKLIQHYAIARCLEFLFAAFQCSVALDPVPLKLRTQHGVNGIARAFLKVWMEMDERV